MRYEEDESTLHEASEALAPLLTERRVSLVVTHRGGVDVVPLEGGAITLGRAEQADVRFRCDRLSRRHARFAVDGDDVWIEDLASTNGTYVNGRRLEARRRLKVDDEVGLGSLRIRLHVMSPWEARLQGVGTHDRFERDLEEEVERSATFGRPLALLMVRATGAGAAEVERWAPQLREGLRTVDRVGLYAPDTLEVLLPEADEQLARQTAEALASRRFPGGPELRIGFAVFPRADDPQELVEAARRALRRTRRGQAVVGPDAGVPPSPGGEGPVIVNRQMRKLYEVVERVAAARVPVLVLGETGTGKELVARALHDEGPRAGGPLRAVNCGAIPAQLLESVLFGHERGAFTGADSRRVGVFEEADGGTVFLDEIGELAPPAQVALLRVLETRRITRIGGFEEIPVDVRVVAATHRDLPAMCEEGSFRLDLYYRLETMTLRIPPLRERVDEVAPLTSRFLAEACEANGVVVRELSPVALAALERYDWPGNVRELRNVVERAVLVCRGARISLEDLPERVQRARMRQTPIGSSVRSDSLPPERDETEPRALPELPSELKAVLRACECALIREALSTSGSNQSEAARLLRMPRRTLIYKLNTLQIEVPIEVEEVEAVVLEAWSRAGDGELDFRARLERVEERVIRAAVDRVGADPAALADALGVHPRTVQSKLQKYGLDHDA